MKEEVLLDYFKNKIGIQFLNNALSECRESNGTTFSLDLEILQNETSFVVTRTHALKLCNEVINGELYFENLNSIAFIVYCSDSFSIAHDDDISDHFFDDWKETAVGYSWTMTNMYKWKNLLEFGVDTFNNADLKSRIE